MSHNVNGIGNGNEIRVSYIHAVGVVLFGIRGGRRDHPRRGRAVWFYIIRARGAPSERELGESAVAA